MNLQNGQEFTQSVHLGASNQHFCVIAVENEWLNNPKVFNIGVGGLLWAFQSDVLCFLVTL